MPSIFPVAIALAGQNMFSISQDHAINWSMD